jgi:hypothetical protein
MGRHLVKKTCLSNSQDGIAQLSKFLLTYNYICLIQGSHTFTCGLTNIGMVVLRMGTDFPTVLPFL